MSKEQFQEDVEYAKKWSAANVVAERRSALQFKGMANKFRPHDPKLADKVDSISEAYNKAAEIHGDIVAYLAERSR